MCREGEHLTATHCSSVCPGTHRQTYRMDCSFSEKAQQVPQPALLLQKHPEDLSPVAEADCPLTEDSDFTHRPRAMANTSG